MEWSMVLGYMRGGSNDSTAFFGHYFDMCDLGQKIVGMANSRGGKIVLGVDLNNYHFLGVDIEEEDILDFVEQSCKPILHLELDIIMRDAKKLMVISVPEGNQKPYSFEGKCYVMEGPQARHALIKEEEEMSADSRVASMVNEEAPNDYNLFERDVAKVTDDLLELSANGNQISSVSEHLAQVLDVREDQLVLDNNSNSGDESDSMEIPDMASDLSSAVVENGSFSSENAKESSNEDICVSVEDLSSNVNEKSSSSTSASSSDLNQRQSLALEFIEENGSIKNREYRDLFDVSHKTAHLELVDLVKRSLIVSTGAGRSTMYILNTFAKVPVSSS